MPPASRWWSTSAWGPHLGFHEALPEHALLRGRGPRDLQHPQDRGSLTQSAMLHLGPPAAGSPPRTSSRAAPCVGSTSPNSLLLASLDRRPPPAGAHGRRCSTARSRPRRARARRSTGSPGARSVGEGFVGRPGTRRLGSPADRHRRPRHRLHGLRAGRRAARRQRHLRRAGHPGDARPRPRPRPAGRAAGALRPRLRRDGPAPLARPGEGHTVSAPPASARAPDRRAGARRPFSVTARRSAVDDADWADLRRVDRRLHPRGCPRCCPASASPRR